MKQCSRCHIQKELTEFYKNAYFPDGLSYWCKPCLKAQIYKSKAEGKVGKPRVKKPPVIHDDFYNVELAQQQHIHTTEQKWDKLMNKLKQSGKVIS